MSFFLLEIPRKNHKNLLVHLLTSVLLLRKPHNRQVRTFEHLHRDYQKKNSGLQSSYSFSNEDNGLFIMV